MSTVETQSGTSAATAGSTPSSFSSVHFSNENSSEYSEFETLYWHLQKHAGHIVQGSAWMSVSSDHRDCGAAILCRTPSGSGSILTL